MKGSSILSIWPCGWHFLLLLCGLDASNLPNNTDRALYLECKTEEAPDRHHVVEELDTAEVSF